MARIGIWFTQGYSNIYNALNDISAADTWGQFKLICSHPHPEFVGGVAADAHVVEPVDCDDEVFLAFVMATVREHGIRVIFPSRKQSFFNRHAKALAQVGVAVATVATTPVLARIDNKCGLYDHLQGKGITKLPEYRRVKSLAEFDAAYADLKTRHPKLCIKPSRGVYGSGFRVLKGTAATMADLLNESMTLPVSDLRARLRRGLPQELMLMQYLPGDEHSVDCVAFEGELVGAVIRRKSTSSVAAQVIEHNPELLGQVRALTKELRLRGMFNVQFKDVDGEPFLLEINTRLSGRSYYATLAGLNIPYVASLLFSGLAKPADLSIETTFGQRVGNISTAVLLPPGTPRARRAGVGGEQESR